MEEIKVDIQLKKENIKKSRKRPLIEQLEAKGPTSLQNAIW